MGKLFLTFTGSPGKGMSTASRDSAKDTENSKSNLPPDTSLWTVTEVVSFFSSLGFPEEAKSFQNQVRAITKFFAVFLDNEDGFFMVQFRKTCLSWSAEE